MKCEVIFARALSRKEVCFGVGQEPNTIVEIRWGIDVPSWVKGLWEKGKDASNKCDTRKMHVVVSRENAKLAGQIRRVFFDDPTVEVIVDRRYGDRRKALNRVSLDCRKVQRRRKWHQVAGDVVYI